MALAEPVALILIFGGHPGDKSHWNERGGGGRERQLLSSVTHGVDLTECSVFMVPFFCFHLKTTSQVESFPLSHSHLSLPGHSAIHLEEENAANAVSPSRLSPLRSLSYRRRSLICLCASSFSPCQSTRRAIYVPLPVGLRANRDFTGSSRGEMCRCISKQGVHK